MLSTAVESYVLFVIKYDWLLWSVGHREHYWLTMLDIRWSRVSVCRNQIADSPPAVLTHSQPV